MENSLVSFSKKLIINSQTKNESLIEFWKNSYGSVVSDLSIHGAIKFETIKRREQIANQINVGVNDYAKYAVKRLKYKIPDVTEFSPEFIFTIADCKVHIHNAETDNPDSYELSLYLITEVVTCISTIGDKLLLSIGDKTAELKAHKEIETFLFTPTENYNITYYKPIIF